MQIIRYSTAPFLLNFHNHCSSEVSAISMFYHHPISELLIQVTVTLSFTKNFLPMCLTGRGGWIIATHLGGLKLLAQVSVVFGEWKNINHCSLSLSHLIPFPRIQVNNPWKWFSKSTHKHKTHNFCFIWTMTFVVTYVRRRSI